MICSCASMLMDRTRDILDYKAKLTIVDLRGFIVLLDVYETLSCDS